MGGVLGKRQGEAEPTGGLAQRLGARGIPGLPGFRHRNSFSEFNLVGMATNLTHRFSVLSGLSVISFVSAPVTSETRPARPWSRVSRKRFQQSTLENEYAHSKTVWPVAQTEVLFLPEFSVGIEEKLKLIFLGEVNRGAFGQVFHVRCANTNKEYAMKVLSKSQVCSLDAVSQVKQEVMIQHVCSHHPFITPLTHFWQTRKLLIVMTEFVGYGELQQLWRSLGRLPENLVKIYTAQIAIALDFLHNAGIIFRDLKMENILLDADGHIKLIDFGLARWLSYGGRTSTICGTLQFMAPEILKGEDYNHSVDWWSLGIIIYSLLVGQYPVSGFDDHITMNNAVEKYEYKPPQCASPAMQSVISGLLNRDPRARTHSFYQLKREYLFANFDFDVIKEKKISPRKILEEYIESRARGNFSEFEGLTSTPKKTIPESAGGSEGDVSHMVGIEKEKPSPSPSFLHPKTADRHHPFSRPGQRSISSPLLHPGRLGHHDSLVKCVSVSGHNGAAMPLLQSPLLRLARDKGAGGQPRRVRSQNAVNASSLPTAVSPLLVNVRGQRRHRWSKWKEHDQNQGRGASSSGTTIATVEGSRGVTAMADGLCDAVQANDAAQLSDAAPDDEMFNSVISGMNGVYKKSNTADDLISGASIEADVRTDDNSSETVTGSTLTPNSVMHRSRTIDNTSSIVFVGNSQSKENSIKGDVDLLERENLRDEFFSDLVTSTPKKSSSFNSSGNLQSTYYQAMKSELPIGKFNLINGALIANNNNFSPLDENDFDESFNQFPWIGQSMDTSL